MREAERERREQCAVDNEHKRLVMLDRCDLCLEDLDSGLRVSGVGGRRWVVGWIGETLVEIIKGRRRKEEGLKGFAHETMPQEGAHPEAAAARGLCP